MKKYYVVLSKEEQELIESETEKWFEYTVGNWSEKTDPSAIRLFATLFKDGTNITLPSGAIVHVKMTIEKFKKHMGEAEFNILKDTFIAHGKALACGVATEMMALHFINIAMAVTIGPTYILLGLWLCGAVVSATLGMLVYSAMFDKFKPKMVTKEVKLDDKGIQEAC